MPGGRQAPDVHDPDAQLLPDLPPKGRFQALARLDLSAGELPKSGEQAAGRTLLEKKLPVLLDDGYDDLERFGNFQDEWLRGGPVRKWVPRGYAGKPGSLFETGGSTGVPKARINIDDFRIDYEMFSETLSDASFPRGADWLMLGPTVPRRLRLSVEHLCQHRGGICFNVDLDPRWVVKLINKGRMDVPRSASARSTR